MSPNSPVTRAQAAVMLTRYWDTPKAKDQLFYDERRPDPGTPGASTAPWADEEEAGTEDPGTVTVPEETKPEDTTPEETKPQTPEEADYIAEVIRLVNQERAKEGLPPSRPTTPSPGPPRPGRRNCLPSSTTPGQTAAAASPLWMRPASATGPPGRTSPPATPRRRRWWPAG